MDYTIGEVADFLHISRDMIRYYEKQGVIQSHRKESNNYRFYDIGVIFWLLEAIQFKNLGVNIRDIPSVRTDEYEKQLAYHLDSHIGELRDEIFYRGILVRRLEQLKDRMILGRHNIGNYWVSRIPAHYICHLVDGNGDQYDRISMPQKASAFIFSDKVNPFTDSGFTVTEHGQSWEVSLEDNYVRDLRLELPEGFSYVPQKLCYCTHIDMGPMGSFQSEVIDEFIEHAVSHNNWVDVDGHWPVTAQLINRGFERDRLHRILELRMPITTT